MGALHRQSISAFPATPVPPAAKPLRWLPQERLWRVVRLPGPPRGFRFPASCNAERGRRCDAGGIALRCLIADDNASFLEAATDLLRRQGVAVVGVASSGAEAVERVRELQPDVALVDIKLGAESGLGSRAGWLTWA